MQVLLDPNLWTLIVAGFMGSTVYTLKKGGDLPWYGKVGLVFAGTAVSYYCADLGASWLSIIISGFLTVLAKVPVEVKVPIGPAGFLCGLLGQVILDWLIGWAIKKKDENLNTPTPP